MATEFTLGLPQLPLNTDPKVEPDLRDLYNAVHNLARLVQTGGAGADILQVQVFS